MRSNLVLGIVTAACACLVLLGCSGADAGKHIRDANLLLAEGRFDEALVEYDELIRIEPQNSQAYNYRGIAYGNSLTVRQCPSSFRSDLLAGGNAAATSGRGERSGRTVPEPPESVTRVLRFLLRVFAHIVHLAADGIPFKTTLRRRGRWPTAPTS